MICDTHENNKYLLPSLNHIALARLQYNWNEFDLVLTNNNVIMLLKNCNQYNKKNRNHYQRIELQYCINFVCCFVFLAL